MVQLYPLLQAGPTQLINDVFVTQNYTQRVYSDPRIDITANVNVSSIMARYQQYRQAQINNAPAYDGFLQNSNTWADALLLANNVPQTTISTWVNELQSASGLKAIGYMYGGTVEPCFIPYGRLPSIAPASGPVGCATPHNS